LKHFGPQILRALLLSAGSEGPRSVIPNLAELLASLVVRVPGEEMASWLNAILAEVSDHGLSVLTFRRVSQTLVPLQRPRLD
jgi:hypothetical protein